MSDTPTHRTGQEGRPSHRPAAPIQRFNKKTIGWPAWFRHFKAVADVHRWDKDQQALQMISYLDEKAMNVAQELSDRGLYDYDVLVKLLSDRFDPASRVSASRSRFHGRTRRHQEDADTYADSITELCRLGYPQSSPELRQELISEQFVRGQSDPELKEYLWVVIKTQKDRKLQTLIKVCTDFASLGHTANVHRPAEQVFALEEDDDREEEMFALVDQQQWNARRAAEPPLSPELQQMFALARRMGYEMRPIAHRLDTPRQTPGPPSSPNKEYRAPFRPCNYSNVLAVASWDTHKFVAPNRTHLSHSGRTGGSTGQMDHSDVMEDHHRETKYRPGPNPHWPVCHRFGPRFIINRHPRYSPGKLIYLHTLWGINH